MSRLNLLHILQYNANFFLNNIVELWKKPNILKIYHKCPYGGNNQKTNVGVGDILLICVLGLPLLLILFVIMIPLICHMCHNKPTSYSWN